ncbi:MAG: PAS domain-containing sensor histidine kinase [Candidatus Moraniibacteriota bacterium]|nr:MAG: PAS domain-containing sensor histidine kinase [Candidatus Moranbacteria bacterium]
MSDDFQLAQENKLPIEDCRALLTAVSQAALVSVTDSRGSIIYANDTFVKVSKYSYEELIGQNHRILKSGDQPDVMFEELWRTISSGKVWRGEIKNRAKDGSYYWVDTSIAPILDASGVPERYIAVRFLITEKKNSEEGIMQQNEELEKTKRIMLNVLEDVQEERSRAESLASDLEKFKVALDGTSDHVVITDPNGVALYANAGLKRITGFSPKEVLGKKVGTKELWGGNMNQEFYENLWRVIKIEKKPFVGEITNTRKDGTPYQALSSISPIVNKHGTLEFFVGIERDITKEKEIDNAKTEFVSLASHQLRTPLSAINWYTEMLLSEDAGSISDIQREYLEEVSHGSRRMVELVNALLNVSRIELGTFAIQPEPTDVVELARDVLNELKPKISEKQLHIKEQFAEDLPKMLIDPKLTRIVFQNLLTNAVKYTPEQGNVSMSIAMSQEKTKFSISVSDTGYGIPKEDQSRIFTKLFRASNIREKETDGTGLGLYIVKSIIEHSGGTVTFESEEEKGTTFTIELPVSGMRSQEGSKQIEWKEEL